MSLCEFCQQPRPPNRRKFCSKKCQQTAWHRAHPDLNKGYKLARRLRDPEGVKAAARAQVNAWNARNRARANARAREWHRTDAGKETEFRARARKVLRRLPPSAREIRAHLFAWNSYWQTGVKRDPLDVLSLA